MKTARAIKFGSSTRAYNLVWAELTNVLDTGQSLRPAGDHNCSDSPPTFVANALFQSLGFLACFGGASLLNPVVLSRVELPDGSAYKFKYNSYGEITRIDYPTGGYERFEYQQIQPVGSELSPYNKSNRGVKFRWVSEGGTGAVEMMSKYEVETGTLESPKYLVRITAPDLSYTEQFLYSESNSGSVYGFTYTFNGRAYDERSYSTTGVLMGRKLTKWTETGSLTINGVAGYPGVTRDLRPEKEVSMIFEPGNTNALASTSETVYDTAGNTDPAYLSSLNAKQSKTYNYVVVNASTATSANITTAAGWFSSSNLAKTAEMDYLYDANYMARNITGLVTETRVKDAAGNIKARSQIGYDESAYPIISAGTNAQWQDPNTNLRANVTTTRSWSDIAANQYIETHAQYDNFGNLRKAWDAKGNVSETEYSSVYQYAYPTLDRTPIPDPTGLSGSNTAFTSSTVFDPTTGLPTSATDANGQTTTIEYNDPLLRPTRTTAPNGVQTITEYGAGIDASTRWVKVKTQIDDTNWKQGDLLP